MSNEVDSVGELLDKVVEIEKNRTKKHHPDAPRAEVVRKGVKMIVPETMGLLDAAKVLVNAHALGAANAAPARRPQRHREGGFNHRRRQRSRPLETINLL